MSTKDDFYNWVYREADKLLEAKLEEEDGMENYENVEQIRKRERKGIEEEFSVDAEGDYMMLEEMDDPTYRNYDRALQDYPYSFHVISDNDETEQSILERLDEDLTEEELNERIHHALSKLPRIQQEVYDLYYLEDLNTKQIAQIKDMEESEIVSLINQVREYLKENFVQN
jgi:RNA polymerase sigma factor (sigma-70 family)